VIHDLLDTSIVSELREPVVAWLESLREDQIYISAVTMGAPARCRVHSKAEPGQSSRNRNLARPNGSFSNLLSMDAACFREWARLRARGSEHLLEGNAMIGATARVHRLKVATRDPSDFALLGVDLCNPFKN